MNYLECKVNIQNPEQSDLITTIFGELGFESFIDEENYLLGYCPQNIALNEKEFIVNIKKALLDYHLDNEFKLSIIEQQNWNATWEKSFEPILVDSKCVIRAPFHSPVNEILNIVIEPKMSFGTGHHQTTFLMLQSMFEIEIENKTVLDMGCGTAVLAILAEKIGAQKVVAIDIEEWAFENALENLALNKCNKILVLKGGAEKIGHEKFDIVIANINKNVLLNDIQFYASSMQKSALLLLSGFFVTDSQSIIDKCKEYSLNYKTLKNKEEWCMLMLEKL
jgi:ribosomal protein L11 methyltransferase